MKCLYIIFAFVILIVCSVQAQTIWSSSNGTITFTKANYADYDQAANQDRITDNVWITRQNNQGIFNINSEFDYSSDSPVGTEWAVGTTADIDALTFDTWVNALGGSGNVGSSIVGTDLVVHFIAEDIYMDIRFLSWTSSDNGGGFSYVRAAGPFEVLSLNATNVTETSATLNGSVFSLSSPATVYALYGTTSGVYTDSVVVAENPIAAGSSTYVSADISGLTPSTLYYFV